MVLAHLGCMPQYELESTGLRRKVHDFFKTLEPAALDDPSHETTTFDPDTKEGRSNIANITAYTIQQAKCNTKTTTFTTIKTIGFEVLKCVVLVLLLWKFAVYAIRDLNGPDFTSPTNRASNIIEGCLMLLIAVSLWLKFDTSAFTMSILTIKQAVMLSTVAIVLGAVFLLLQSNFEHWKIKIAFACGLLVLSLVTFIVMYKRRNNSIREEMNKGIAVYNTHVHKKMKLPQIQWRQRIPNFTDRVFISIASYLLLSSAITKFQN